MGVYNDLAWGGLKGTVPYNLLSQDTKDRIDSITWAETINQTQQQYNPRGVLVATHIPKGTPCSN